MAHFDKYDPIDGGFRARLLADWAAADGTPVAVGLDTAGRIVPGAGNTGIIGIVIVNSGVGNFVPALAGDVQDVMKDGVITDVGDTGFAGRAAGVKVYGIPGSGALTATATSGNFYVGFMVEADRLVVGATGRTV